MYVPSYYTKSTAQCWGFSNFLNYRFEFEKKIENIFQHQELRTFSFFQRKHIRTETTIFTKINLSEKEKSFWSFCYKKCKKNRKKNCSNMSIHCAVLWPDEHLKCKCSNYATTLVTLVAQQYMYTTNICVLLSPFYGIISFA